MDQIKIGRFIAVCRKKKSLTQMQLAEKLGITDRAVSKWETGKAMPDSSLMLPLCAELEITVTDLLNGEVVTMENYNEAMEKSLLEAVRQKQQADRQMLALEIVIGLLGCVIMFGMVAVASFVQMQAWLRVTLIASGFVIFIIAMCFGLKIEQTAGYYACAHCKHRYVPAYRSVLFAMHINRTRYMKCPKCGKRTWNKKVLEKE